MLPQCSNAACVTNDTTSPQDVYIGCGNLDNPTRPAGSSTVCGKAPATTELRVAFTRGGYTDGVNRQCLTGQNVNAHTLSIIPMSKPGCTLGNQYMFSI
jgi:hypothetical protein